jgi:hypothetical protein
MRLSTVFAVSTILCVTGCSGGGGGGSSTSSGGTWLEYYGTYEYSLSLDAVVTGIASCQDLLGAGYVAGNRPAMN